MLFDINPNVDQSAFFKKLGNRLVRVVSSRMPLKACVTMEEIMEVLKLCVAQGVQVCNLGVTILAEEQENRPKV